MPASRKKIFRFSLVLILVILTVYYFYPEGKFPPGITVDKIEVYKSEHKLIAYSSGRLIKTYSVSIGGDPVGPKQFEGDKKTPEGLYHISAKNVSSGFHRSLTISYPNKIDLVRALAHGKLPGGNVEIHGLKNGLGFIGKFQRWFNWTAGCVALTNREVDELYDHTPVGTKIEIKP